MSESPQRREVRFTNGGSECAAWFYRGHVFRVAACNPAVAAAIAQTPNADGPAADRNAMRSTVSGD